jgi:DNA polymerase-3 subunit gamma/tau
MLSGTAFNAFLKTLEEPPGHVVFVLATTEPHRVIPTILSRCQRFDFHRVGVRDIEQNVRKIAAAEGIEIDDKAIAMLAHAADGSVRDSLTLLDQAFAYAEEAVTPEVVTEILGGIEFDLLAEFTDVLLQRDISGALALIERVVGEGKDLRQLVEGLLSHYRNLLLLRVDRRGRDAIALPEESVKRTAEQANSASAEEIVRILDLFAETDRELRFTSQPRLLLELCAVRICQPAKGAEAAAPAQRKERRAAPRPAQAEPAEAAEAEEVAEGVKEEAAGPVELADLKRRWDEVLGGLRKVRQGSVAAFLREAAPVGLEGDVVTLAFNHRFHYDQMMDRKAKGEERRKAAGDAIARVFGREMTVKYEMGTETARAEGPGEQEEVKDYLSMFPGSELEE